MSEGMIFRLVAPGAEAAGVVGAYSEAVALAARVHADLVTAGLEDGSVLVVPSLTDVGRPVVYLSPLTPGAGRLLAQILHGGAGHPGPGRTPGPCRSKVDGTALGNPAGRGERGPGGGQVRLGDSGCC